MLKTAARRVWRSPETVQFGLDPDRAVVLTGVDDAVAGLLAALDGSNDTEQLRTLAQRLGLPVLDADHLLHDLSTNGVLDDGAAATGLADRHGLRALLPWERQQLTADRDVLADQDDEPGRAGRSLQRRRAAAVRVAGAGRVGAQISLLLAAAGVANVEPVDAGVVQPADLAPGGLPPTALDVARSQAVRDRIAELAPSAGTGAVDPDVVVLVGAGAQPQANDLLRAGVAHLAIDIRSGSTLVGPFVHPGRSACLGCLDRLRTDRDPAWPTIAAQLSVPGEGLIDAPSSAAVAALATLQVLMHIDGGRPTATNALIDVRLPDGFAVRRALAPHPLCGCTWPG